MTGEEFWTVTFGGAEAGERLDRALALRRKDLSRTTLQRWIDEGRVQIDGTVAHAKHRVKAGETARVVPAPPPASEALPEPIDLELVHLDEDLLVVDKQAGLVVHPAPGHRSGTLVNAVLFHAPPVGPPASLVAPVSARRSGQGSAGAPAPPYPRPGIVHRLDKDTSGLMVVARSEFAKERLVEAFQARDVEREYLAICAGRMAACRIVAPIGRHPRDRKRFTSTSGKGKHAVTHVAPREDLGAATLLTCRLETGRTHQIRVHLADRGHGLLGDPVYGARAPDSRVEAIARTLGRQALHAATLGFIHPRTGRAMRFESPPPADFQQALEGLRALRGGP